MGGFDLEYGWYKWEDGLRQKDGFFVDRFGRVLYWPSRSGPGYVIKEENIKKSKESIDGEFVRIYLMNIWLISPLFIVYSFLYLYDGNSIINFIKEVHIFGVIIVFFMVLAYVATFCVSDYDVDLSNLKTVQKRRPAVRDYLIPAKAKPAEEFWYLTLLCLAATLGIAILLGWSAYDSFLRAREAGKELNWLFGYALATAMGAWVLAIVLARIIRRIRARNGPYSLAYLTSRIKVADGLTAEMLQQSRDVKKPPPLFGRTTGGKDGDGDKTETKPPARDRDRTIRPLD